MIEFRDFTRDNYDKLKDMMMYFYRSEAVEHPIDEEVIARLLDDILSGEYTVKGLEVLHGGKLVGFGVMTKYYTSEVAGITLQLEDLYIEQNYRSLGIAKEYFSQVKKKFPDVKRFRLEVAKSNTRAIRLYEKMGFKELEYMQMVIDK